MERVEFGTDGIRGVVGEWPWVKPIVIRIGQALGEFIRMRNEEPCVVIGRDTRPSGADLLGELSTGLMGQGIHVINLGIMTTPGVAFLTRQSPADLGVIVSASHSPLEYNGIKLVGSNGLRLQREEEIEIESLINHCIERPPKYTNVFGQESDGHHLVETYINDHVRCCPVRSLEGFKVVLDSAHGATSRIAPEAFRRLGAEVVVINDSAEGRSINYHCGSEYVREHPDDLIRAMQQHDVSYGFAFDGDGDRLVVVDADGRVFDGQDLLFVLARHFHSQRLLRGKTVVTSRLANRGLEKALRRFGIQIVYTSKGDKDLEAAMWGGDYLLGAEPGGNIIINDGHHTAADAVYAALVLGGILVQNQDLGLREMVSKIKRHPQEIVSFEVSSKLSLKQKEEFEKHIGGMLAELGEEGRILFWESTTEPRVFRVLAEGGRKCTKEEVSRVARAVRQLIEQAAAMKK